MNREALSEVVLFATRRETLRLVREGWDKARLRHVDTVDKSLPRTDLVGTKEPRRLGYSVTVCSLTERQEMFP
jgi:hypothetical protein